MREYFFKIDSGWDWHSVRLTQCEIDTCWDWHRARQSETDTGRDWLCRARLTQGEIVPGTHLWMFPDGYKGSNSEPDWSLSIDIKVFDWLAVSRAPAAPWLNVEDFWKYRKRSPVNRLQKKFLPRLSRSWDTNRSAAKSAFFYIFAVFCWHHQVCTTHSEGFFRITFIQLRSLKPNNITSKEIKYSRNDW